MGGSYIATVFDVPIGFQGASHYGANSKTTQKHPFFTIFGGLETVDFVDFGVSEGPKRGSISPKGGDSIHIPDDGLSYIDGPEPKGELTRQAVDSRYH